MADQTRSRRIWIGITMGILAAFLCIAVRYVLLIQPNAQMSGSTLTLAISLAFFSAPYLFIVLGLLSRKLTPWAIGVGLGVACWEIPHSAFVAFTNLVFAGAGSLRLLFIPPHLMLILGLLMALRLEKRQLVGIAVGLVLGVSYAVGIRSIYNTHPQWLLMAPPRVPGNDEIYRFLLRSDACLWEYAHRHPGSGFPKALDDVNEIAPECSSVGAFVHQSPIGFQVTYQSKVAGSEKVPEYYLRVQEDTPFQRGIWSDYTDDSGIIHFDFTDKNASPASPVLTIWMPDSVMYLVPAGGLAGTTKCIRRWTRSHASSPPNLAEGITSCLDRPFLTNKIEGNSYRVGGYEITYVSMGNKDHPGDFTLEARPESYGATGLRSYFVDQSFLIHATPENRSATASDPEALPCEFNANERCPGK